MTLLISKDTKISFSLQHRVSRIHYQSLLLLRKSSYLSQLLLFTRYDKKYKKYAFKMKDHRLATENARESWNPRARQSRSEETRRTSSLFLSGTCPVSSPTTFSTDDSRLRPSAAKLGVYVYFFSWENGGGYEGTQKNRNTGCPDRSARGILSLIATGSTALC